VILKPGRIELTCLVAKSLAYHLVLNPKIIFPRKTPVGPPSWTKIGYIMINWT